MQANLFYDFRHEVVITIMVTLFIGTMTWPFRKVKDFATGVKKTFDNIHSELVMQRTNCLTTLQNKSDDQIKVLEKVSGTLESIHTSQAEMSGYLRGMNR